MKSTKAIIEVALATSSALITTTLKKCNVTLLDSCDVPEDGVTRLAISHDSKSYLELAYEKLGVTQSTDYPEIEEDTLAYDWFLENKEEKQPAPIGNLKFDNENYGAIHLDGPVSGNAPIIPQPSKIKKLSKQSQSINERIFSLMEVNLNKLITLTEMTQAHNTELLQTVENQTALIERLTGALNQSVCPLGIAIGDKVVTIGEPWAITMVGEDKPFTATLMIKDGDIKWQCTLGHHFYTDKVTPLFKRDIA